MNDNQARMSFGASAKRSFAAERSLAGPWERGHGYEGLPLSWSEGRLYIGLMDEPPPIEVMAAGKYLRLVSDRRDQRAGHGAD